jgi:choice-of-anchor A domain-containing protein
VMRNFPSIRTIAANTDQAFSERWSTFGITLSNDGSSLRTPPADLMFADGFERPAANALGDYVAILVASIGGADRVLAQTLLKVVDYELTGTLTATPNSVRRGAPITLAASARNSGNLAATALPFTLSIIRNDTNQLVREFNYTSDVAIAATINRSETIDSASLTPGSYTARWKVARSGGVQNLAQASFAVLQPQLGGTIAVNPTVGIAGTNFLLNANVRNLGNAAAVALPMRLEVKRADTQAVIQAWNETNDINPSADYPFPRVYESVGATPGQYSATISANVDGTWTTFASASFEISLPLTDVVHQMSIQRDARVLVLVSCSANQVTNSLRTSGADFATRSIEAASTCETQKRQFIQTWLANRGIEHKVVTTAKDWLNELRCGKYNVHWLAGGSAKLSSEQARELAEVIYRGEGLLQDSNDLQTNAAVDALAGFSLQAQLANDNQRFSGAGTLFPAISLPSYGKGLRYLASGAQIEASFDVDTTPAILSNNVGVGRTLSYAFDLVELLKRDGSQAASARLFDNALTHVAPTVAVTDYAGGTYVAVTTQVQNRGQAIDLRLAASTNAPAQVSASRPAATAQNSAQNLHWDFNLPIGTTRSFDAGVQTPLAGTPIVPTDAITELARRDGAQLTPIGSKQISLTQRDLAQTQAALIAGLNAASLTGNEAQARTRAITAINLAANQLGLNNPLMAIQQWLLAADEIKLITSTSNATWRLSNARLMELGQRHACGLRTDQCDVFGDSSPYSALAFESFTAQNSTAEGRIASGAATNLANYQIGTALAQGTQGASMVIGGALTFSSGRVHRGNIMVAGSITGVDPSITQAFLPSQQLIQTNVLPVAFGPELQRLFAETSRLNSLTVNGSTQVQGATLSLQGNGLDELQVFSATAAQFAATNRIDISGVTEAASVLINVSGTSLSINHDMSGLVSLRSRLLFNLPQVSTLTLAGTVEAAILAPRAATQGNAGQLFGNIVLSSWNGPMVLKAVRNQVCTGTPVRVVSAPIKPVKN